MKKINIYLLTIISVGVLGTSSCEWLNDLLGKCKVDPDLITDLLAPASTIIQGETVEWDYVIESVEENSQDCDILNAAASISKFVIDYFIDQNDNNGDIVFNQQANISELEAGSLQTINETVDVFNDEGIYLISSTADATNLVKERNENNNIDDGEINIDASTDDIFENASEAFKAKLSKSGAIVIIGRSFNDGIKVHSYNGKPIYYAN